jgi:cytochrome c553
MKNIFALMVSFLLMSGATWAADEIPAKAAMCVGCHGVNGNSTMPGVRPVWPRKMPAIFICNYATTKKVDVTTP